MSAFVLDDGRRVVPAFLLNSESGGGIVTPPASFRLPDGRTATGIVLVDEAGDIVPAGLSQAQVAALLGAYFIDWESGRSYDSRSSFGGSVSTAALTAQQWYLSPIIVPPGGVTIDQLTVPVTVAAAAGKLLRLAAYTKDLALIVDGGTVAADATGDRSVTVSATLPAGVNYLAVISDGAPTVGTIGGAVIAAEGVVAASTNFRGGLTLFTGAFNPAPDPFVPGSYFTNTLVRVICRVA